MNFVTDLLSINSFNHAVSIRRHFSGTFFFECNTPYKDLLSLITSTGIQYVSLNKSSGNSSNKLHCQR